MNILVFNIETTPDIEGGQAIFDLQGLDDKSTAKAMMHMHQQKTGCDSLPCICIKLSPYPSCIEAWVTIWVSRL